MQYFQTATCAWRFIEEKYLIFITNLTCFSVMFKVVEILKE